MFSCPLIYSDPNAVQVFSSEFTLNGRTVDKRIVLVERVNPAEGLQRHRKWMQRGGQVKTNVKERDGQVGGGQVQVPN